MPVKNAPPVNQCFIWEYAHVRNTADQGEGCRGPTPTMRATQWETEFIMNTAKCGNPLPMGCGPNQRSPRYSAVQKRSYHRACKRAMAMGATWYRGRVVTTAEFPEKIKQRVLATAALTPNRPIRVQYPQSRSGRKRLSVLTWNPGGMAYGKLAEIRHWLHLHPHDVVVLPETRWGFEKCWSDDAWHYIHSHTTQQKAGGLLIMINRKLIQSEHIGYEVVVPGRLLHVRLHFLSSALDILAVYQHADDSTLAQLQQRHIFWDKLDDFIYNLPKRNQLICCGDFNSALPAAPPWTGTGTFRWNGLQQTGRQHKDMQRFLQILRNNTLTAANSWSAAIGPSYFHSDYAARIDFFLVRLHSCDGATKDAFYLHEAEFLPVNQTHHFPLVCTVPQTHVKFHHSQYKPACNYRQRLQCRLASLQETEEWLRLSQHVADSCRQRLHQAASQLECISDWHQDLVPIFQTLFPDKRPLDVTADPPLGLTEITNKWHHRRCIRQINHLQGGPTLESCLQAWFHWSQFRKKQREHQRLTRRARLQRFHRLCEEAQDAANTHDAHALFQVINRHTPKRPLQKARIKTADGKIADQYTAHRMTLEHVATTWQGPDELRMNVHCSPGVPVTIEAIERVIMNLHPNKSVACPFLPAVVLKSAPHELACYIHQLLQGWWMQNPPLIPQTWRDAWLFFLPKPGKPGTHPSQLRPISLMEPVGKFILGLLTEQLKSFHLQKLCSEPHFGFLPKRSALDAVRRVVSHCIQVRTLIALQRRTIARQMATKPLYTFCGGMQMYLDLKHAFDSVNRVKLFQHLQDLHTPEYLVSLFTAWHMGTRYNLMFQGQTTSIPVNIGLRQGCKAAPLLWVLYMNYFVSQLSQKIDPTWLAETLTIYADDIHVGAIFYSIEEYHRCRQRFGCILDVIEQLQLELSYEKTFIILALAGSNVKKGSQGTISRTLQGATIALPRANQKTSAIPLRTTSKYLGTELSYGQFETQTWKLRLKAGRSAFVRLRCWFKNKQLGLQHRLYLWRTCVHTILMYGLCATHVNPKILHEYQTTVYMMMRTIIQDHSYCTHRTHQQVFTAHGLELPLQLFARHVAQYWQRLQRRDLALHSSDFMHRVDWSHLPEMQKLIQCVAESTMEAVIDRDASVPVQTQAVYNCTQCAFSTTSVPNLRRHMTNQHSIRQFRTSNISPISMTVKGRPQCNHCFMAFTTWRRFFIHVERNCCQVPLCRRQQQLGLIMAGESTADARGTLAEAAAGPIGRTAVPSNMNLAVMTAPFWTLLQEVAANGHYDRLMENPQLGAHMTHQCIICDQWCNRCQEMNAHLRLHHSEVMHGVLAKGAQITHLLASQSPCQLCHKTFRRSHCCSVANQVALLQLICTSPEDKEAAIRTCIICNHTHDDIGQLHRHLSSCHNISVNDWCPSRDAHQHSDACSHCGATFLSRSGLQRHILDGRCMMFNPDASPQPLQAAEKWKETLHQGDLTRQALSPAQRQELTLVCQLCGTRYSRQTDLSAHLMQSHSALWQRSQSMLRFLIQSVQARHGCQCNPSCNAQGQTHICVMLRQFAMIYMTSPSDLLIPQQFPADFLQELLQPIAHVPLHNVLEDAILTRQFHKLWQIPGLVGLLKQWCVTCGNLQHPAALVVHHWQHHGERSQWSTQMKFQLVACLLKLQAQDMQCDFCGLMVNPPVLPDANMDPQRLLNMQTHFDSSCPIAHQVALLLHPLHGRADDGARSTRSCAAGIFQAAESPATSSQPVQERQRGRAPAQKSKAGSRPRRKRHHPESTASPACHDGHVERDGPPPSSTREEHAAPTSPRLIYLLLSDQSSRSGPSAHPAGSGLEESSNAESHQPSSANHEDISVQRHDQRNTPAGAEDGQELQRRGPLGQGHPAGDSAAGWRMDLSEMESTGAVPDASGQTCPPNGSPPEAATTHGGNLGGFLTRDQIPLPETTANDSAVVPADLHAPERTLAHHGGVTATGNVEFAGAVDEGAQPIPIPTSANAPTMSPESTVTSQRTWEGEAHRETQGPLNDADRSQHRHRLRQCLRSLVLENDGHMCYANSAVQAMMWSFLSRTTFVEADWGEYSELFHALISHSDSFPMHLEHIPGFQTLVANWPEWTGQADSTEFSSILLKGAASRCCNNSWERRVQEGQTVTVQDRGHHYMPITVQLEPELEENGSVRLNELIRHWHYEWGMSAGLVHDTDLICLHVDRFVRSPTGMLQKDETPIGFLGGVQFPTFSTGIDCDWHGYQVIAMISHTGDQSGGHYQALLKVGPESLPGQPPYLWLHCDDNRAPQPCWHVPPRVAENATCFWLCRCEVGDYHDMRIQTDSHPHQARSDQMLDQAMMTFLSNSPRP